MSEPHDRSSRPYGAGRNTPQRRLVVEVASAWTGAFTVEDLAGAVRERDRAASVATVYRAVSALLVSGWLERVGERSGSALFARCHAGSHHHHHVVCDRCGRVAEAECPVAADLSTGAAKGFVITRHEVTLYGLCPTCVAEKAV